MPTRDGDDAAPRDGDAAREEVGDGRCRVEHEACAVNIESQFVRVQLLCASVT